MGADRRRAAERRSINVERGGLAVVRRKEDRLRALVRRQVAIDCGDRGRHFAPAEHVGEVLRQRRELHALGLRRLGRETGRLHIGDQRIGRQDRQDDRYGQEAGNDDDGDRDPARDRALEPRLPRDAAGREQRWIDRRDVVGLAVGRR